MYDTLLFLHVLAAFMLGATVVVTSAVALGSQPPASSSTVANVLWDVGGLGTLVFGVWLALYVDGYEIWDAWILGAIVLWALATETGRRARDLTAPNAITFHWIRVFLFLLLLADMVVKPWAWW